MFVRKSGPVKLRGKAAEIKCLGEPLLAYWSTCCDETNEQHQQILYLLQMSCRCEEILFENKSALAFSHLDFQGRKGFYMCHVLCQPCFASFWSRWWRCSSLPRSCLCLWALGSLTLVPFPRNWFEKARPCHMHQQDTCNLPQCIAEQVFKSKACLVLYWRRYDVHCTAAHTSLHKGKYTFVRPNKVFRTLANCHALGVAELKKNAVLTSLHPLPHQLLMTILSTGAAS